MANYLRRIEAVEKIVAPRNTCVLIVLDNGQTEDEALAAFAKARGLAASEIGQVVYVSFVDSRL